MSENKSQKIVRVNLKYKKIPFQIASKWNLIF